MARIIKPLAQQKAPLPIVADLPLANRQEWEQTIFADATHFTVCRKIGPGTFHTEGFPDLAAAMRSAVMKQNGKWKHDPKAMLYCVDQNGRSFCLPPKEWKYYLARWEKTNELRLYP